MSRIGKKEIFIPEDIKVEINRGFVITSKGNLLSKVIIPPGIKVILDNSFVKVVRENDSKILRSLHGLIRKLIYNSVTGFSNPFQKTLQVKGVGFKASVSSGVLTLNVGFSHPVNLNIPREVSVKIDPKQNQIFFESYDRSALGEFVATVRNVRPPEPYKGTGIMYLNERIIRKAGKSDKRKK